MTVALKVLVLGGTGFIGRHAGAASGCDYSIVRPSLLDGEGGFGASWLRGLSRSPLHIIPKGASGSIAAMLLMSSGFFFSATISRHPTVCPSYLGERSMGSTRLAFRHPSHQNK